MSAAPASGPVLGALPDPLPPAAALAARLAAFQWLAAPLLAAVVEMRPQGAGPATDLAVDPAADAAETARLIDSVLALAEATVGAAAATGPATGMPATATAGRARWQAAVTAAHVVAARYRATGQVPQPALDPALVDALAVLMRTVEPLAGLLPAGPPPAADPNGPATGSPREGGADLAAEAAATFRLRLVDALTPVVGAVARYAFGRDEAGLLAEIADRLTAGVTQRLDRLVPAGSDGAGRLALAQALLQAGAELYAECHYAEMDRLLALDAEALAAYGRSHDDRLPLEPVWLAWQMRLDLLAGVIARLDGR